MLTILLYVSIVLVNYVINGQYIFEDVKRIAEIQATIPVYPYQGNDKFYDISALAHDSNTWAFIIEKAFQKLNHSYIHAIAGLDSDSRLGTLIAYKLKKPYISIKRNKPKHQYGSNLDTITFTSLGNDNDGTLNNDLFIPNTPGFLKLPADSHVIFFTKYLSTSIHVSLYLSLLSTYKMISNTLFMNSNELTTI